MTRLFVIDTETGGIDPTRFSLLTFAGAIWEDGQILETIHFSIREARVKVEPEAMSINRIDLKEHQKNAIPPKLAVAQLNALLDRAFPETQIPIAGHNVNFDVSFLRRLYRLSGEEYPSRFSRRHVDTASVLTFLDICGLISLDKPSLDNALRLFNISYSPESRHTALGDVLATCELLNRMKARVLDHSKPNVTPTEAQ